ncbi:MAG: S46 family peptidase [Bacteroidales bacterium]|nr:S46 family peptidase [Bacteroidales bacterium]
MKKIILIIITCIHYSISADEGMWLLTLSKEKYEELKKKGLKLTLSEIYNTDSASIKDAVVLFGGGCTGSFISANGLVLTNHHCGYSYIQRHSTIEHDYLTDGFWAKNYAEELANPGLTVSVLESMEDVTNKVLLNVSEVMTETERNMIISNNIKKIIESQKPSKFTKIDVVTFFNGNVYMLVKYKVFKDVRLVGAPPSAIGKFGGDTDNWIWPRHTGDFALFRVYANKNNEPAEYSPDNVPYKPKKYFKVSISGVKENDFTMVIGFPGKTNEYCPSYTIEHVMSINPIRIKLRELRLEILKTAMDTNRAIKIKYASKQASIANYWKKWIGELEGLKFLKVVEKKKEFEKEFDGWANISYTNIEKYGNILNDFREVYKNYTPLAIKENLIHEGIFGIEILTKINLFENIVKCNDTAVKTNLKIVQQSLMGFYNNYIPIIDKQTFIKIFSYFAQNNYLINEIPTINKLNRKFKNWEECANIIFNNSYLTSLQKLKELEKFSPSKIKKIITNDYLFKIYSEVIYYFNNYLASRIKKYKTTIDSLNRLYTKAQLELIAKEFYPDANSTLRISYGNIKKYQPRDGIIYNWYTTLDGIIEKEDTTILDYVVPEKLKTLYYKKDYGKYAQNDTLTVCFIANNHTTGGNSGSPVLNAYGNLIGCNFDRTWESTMSDYYYNPDRCRNISVDIRYVLFIIDKFAEAKNILNEIEIVDYN